MKKASFIFLPILFFVYIAVETFLKLNHSSLCESTGCQLADSLLLFDSIYLNYIGMVAALSILIVGWLSFKEIISEKLFYIVVVSALLFETIMLGYQYFASPEMCKFCMGVYSFLVVILLTGSRKYFAVALPVVISVVMALSFLAIPQSKAFVLSDGKYLIQSEHCSHCKKVKAYLKKEDIAFTKIDIEGIEARNFATFLNFSAIPILITKEGDSIKIIKGDRDIIDSFKMKPTENIVDMMDEGVTVTTEDTSSVENTDIKANSDIFEAAQEDEGCGFATLTKLESDCSKE